ncbi:hypothetical protein RFI_28364 [Reticulomyxa filosa]|uniref:Uncharacterized protein n=1 Tax=Reticulomyxa filosa TaxID=46433 RepID=X6M4W4_RETFI|nr:hypothetical protein RFI_28364 [Reticulomyxa filosa]|eukprot:ETO09023.1 hypothetical protein RFI_28364 [Reticulomyxa filosa]
MLSFFIINIIMITIIVNLIQKTTILILIVTEGSNDKTVRVWSINENEQILSLDGHSNWVYCVKFPLFYKNMWWNVICSASLDETIRFWDIEKKNQFDLLHGYKNCVFCIEFSPLEVSQYLFSGCGDNNIYLYCAPLNVSNLGVIDGNGFSFCSGSYDNTIRVWDINTCKQLLTINAHKNGIIIVGSLYGHKCGIYSAEFSPYIIENIESGDYSDVICSGSYDNTIRFWDIRSCAKQLFTLYGDKNDGRITSFNFMKKKGKNTICLGTKNGKLYFCE